MLFTDFLQTHQSNLHPSDRFPLLNFTKIFRGDANPSNNHRVKAGLWDLREWYIIRNHSEHSTVDTRQKTCEWAFEWKVIQHSTCHGSQRQTISSSQKAARAFWCFAQWSLRFSNQRGPPTARVRSREEIWGVKQVRKRLTLGAWLSLDSDITLCPRTGPLQA